MGLFPSVVGPGLFCFRGEGLPAKVWAPPAALSSRDGLPPVAGVPPDLSMPMLQMLVLVWVVIKQPAPQGVATSGDCGPTDPLCHTLHSSCRPLRVCQMTLGLKFQEASMRDCLLSSSDELLKPQDAIRVETLSQSCSGASQIQS